MDSDKRSVATEVAGPGLSVPNLSSRRRLLQAGLGAAPAMLTVVSEPVRAYVTAATVPCASASALGSIGASANTRQTCSGLTPDSWNGKSVGTWPDGTFVVSRGAAVSELFGQIFSPGVKAGGTSSPTLKDVVSSSSTTRNVVLAKYFVAAYLNFKQGYTPPQVVTDVKLQAMWPQALNGSYAPVAGGKPWSDNDLVNWFKQTMAN
jgi:hypothetical protein